MNSMLSQSATDPDFPAPKLPRATHPNEYPASALFVVVDIATPSRIEHTTLDDALADARAFKFPDDLLILVYENAASTHLLDVLSPAGQSVR